jgi:hypothetical protein
MTGQRDAKGAEEESNGQSLAEQTVAPQVRTIDILLHFGIRLQRGLMLRCAIQASSSRPRSVTQFRLRPLQPILQLHPSMPHYAQMHFAQNHALQEELREFWDASLKDVEGAGADPAEFKNQQLPLARIKKVSAHNKRIRWLASPLYR